MSMSLPTKATFDWILVKIRNSNDDASSSLLFISTIFSLTINFCSSIKRELLQPVCMRKVFVSSENCTSVNWASREILKCLSWNIAKKSLRWWAWSRFNQHSCRQNVEQIHKWNSRISSSLASPNLYERFLHVECRESRTYILCWFMRCFSSILWTNGRRRKERKTRKDDECFCEQRKTRWWLSRATQSAHTPWLFERSQSKV